MWTNEMTVGGAGFLSSPGNFGTQISSEKKEKTSKSDNVVPCTVAHLHLTNTERAMVGSLFINNVSLLGMVRSVDEQSTRITFLLDDMTGPPIEIQLWHGDGEEKGGELRSRIVESSYVRVVGNMRTIKDKKLVLAYKVIPVMDLNEISMHILEVIHTGMAIAMMEKKLSTSAAFDYTLNAPQATIPVTTNITNTDVNTNTSGSVATNASSMQGLSAQQQMVLRVIMECQKEEGMFIDQLCESLGNLSRTNIRSVIDFLCSEGHVYSTVDEDHFKATDS